MKFIFLLLLLANSTVSMALSDTDREYCEKLLVALEAALPVVEDAESLQGNSNPVKLKWSDVKTDLTTIINGLREAQQIPRREPRTLSIGDKFSEIIGDYH